MNRYLAPLGIAIVLVVFLGAGLRLNPREIPSPLISKPAPHFTLPQLQAPERTLSVEDMRGKVWLLNVWASWCAACRDEHSVLVQLAQSSLVPIYGLNYKDRPGDALAWLGQFGNPYALSVADMEGKIGIDYGVYGVPETFVIDKNGTIRHKQVGPLTPEVLKSKILPLVKALNQ